MPTSRELHDLRPLRVLVLRLGSMGDIIHAMPAVTVLRRMLPNATLGWLVEERWHELLSAQPGSEGLLSAGFRNATDARALSRTPLVDMVHTVDTLGWRKALLSGETWKAMRTALHQLREIKYDVAIDFQGAWKTAMVAKLIGAPVRLGFRSPRESLAAMLYNRQHIATELHVIEQNLGMAWALLDSCPDDALRGQELPQEAQRVRTLPAPPRDPERKARRVPPIGAPFADRGHHRTTTAPRVPFPIDPKADEWCEGELARLQLNGREFAIMNPGAGWGSKCWPVERFAEVALALSEEGLRSVVNYGPNEEPLAQKLETLSRGAAVAVSCSIAELIALTRRARLFVGGDTGPLHLAAALGIPAVAIFGPTDPVRNGPFGTPSVVLSTRERRTSHARPHARLPETGESLTSITSPQVLAAARQLLAATSSGEALGKGQPVE